MPASTTFLLSPEKVPQGLVELKNQKLLCDVHLVAEDKTYQAHKVVLAAGSPYFRAMFTGGFKEKDLSVITLKETSANGLKCVVDAIYAAKITITEENAEDVLSVASLLQINDIVKACERFLSNNITEYNSLNFLSLSGKYQLREAVNKSHEFILGNFEAIAMRPEFIHIPKDELVRYISDDRLRLVHGETQVFRAVMKWIKHNQHSDKHTDVAAPRLATDSVTTDSNKPTDPVDIAEIMKHVKFPRIPSDILIDEVLPAVYTNKQCRNLVTEAIRFHNHTFTQPLKTGQQYSPRGEHRLLLIPSGIKLRLNGYIVKDKDTQLYFLNATNEMPFSRLLTARSYPSPFALRSMTIATHRNYLFMFGTDNKSFNTVALRYDVTSNKWIDLKAPPFQATIGAVAAKAQEHIFLLGGMLVTKDTGSLDPHQFTTCSLKYSIKTNTWTEACTLPQAVAFHAATSVGNSFYMAGGYIGPGQTETTSDVYSYDVQGNVWLTKAQLHEGRSMLCLDYVCDSLVALGGIAHNEAKTSIEIYSILENQWTVMQNSVLEHCVCSATVVMNDKLFVVGGMRKEPDGKWTNMETVSCIDVKTNRLFRVSRLPFQSGIHVCAMLKVPRV